MARRTPSSPNLRALALIVFTSFVCTSALAQWQWVDSTGRKVFSDMPPPAGTPDKSILKRPGLQIAPVGSAEDAAPAVKPGVEAVIPKLTGSDKELEAKKKAADEAEAAKRKAEEERVAKARENNCERAKRGRSTLDSGIRIATTNAKGEREIMDDKARAAETARLDEAIRSNCGPAI